MTRRKFEAILNNYGISATACANIMAGFNAHAAENDQLREQVAGLSAMLDNSDVSYEVGKLDGAREERAAIRAEVERHINRAKSIQGWRLELESLPTWLDACEDHAADRPPIATLAGSVPVPEEVGADDLPRREPVAFSDLLRYLRELDRVKSHTSAASVVVQLQQDIDHVLTLLRRVRNDDAPEVEK